MFNRSSILRSAHAATRARMAPKRIPFPGFVLDREVGAFVCTLRYRDVFAEELRKVWAGAKAAADRLKIQPVARTAEQLARFRDLMDAAWMQPITRTGNMRHVAMMSAAIAEVRA